ncbi:MAG: Crp/Fnr family transcriptional regulator [Fibrobacterota bacterium]|nr:Crp/Fnr family transcriptional regulator [Fibrobacterota bacterium]QQS04802.1 MAG: Crp/Fnr family transcriptional regulator [Fibrobacterota bacterium]
MTPPLLKTFHPNQLIFREGLPGSSTYVVRSGTVEISVLRAGKKHVLAFLGEGEIFGEMAPFDGGLRSATACASTACEIWCVRTEGLQQMVEQSPQFVQAIFQALVRRVRALDRIIAPAPEADGWIGIAHILELLAGADAEDCPDTVNIPLPKILRRLPDVVGRDEGMTKQILTNMAQAGLFRIVGFLDSETLVLERPASLVERTRLRVAESKRRAHEEAA